MSSQRPLPKRIAVWVGKALLWLGAGLAALVLLVVLGANLKPGREFLRARVNSAIAEMFVGTVVIERLGAISPYALSGVDVRVLDARGKTVVRAHGLTLGARWPSIVWDLVRGRPLTISLEPIRGDHVEVVVIDDGKGSPTLASAFSPRSPVPKTQPETPSTTTILIPNIEIRHVWAHGGLAALSPIDAELAGLGVSVASRPEALELELAKGKFVTRALPQRVDPSGSLTAKVRVPSAPNAKPSVIAKFEGLVAEAGTTLRAELSGDNVQATLAMPQIPAEAVRARAEGVTLAGPTAFEAEATGTTKDLKLSASLRNAALRLGLTGRVQSERGTRISADVALSRVNANAAVQSAPVTDLQASITVRATLAENGTVAGDYRVRVEPGRADGVTTPELRTQGTIAQASGELDVEGKLELVDPGLELRADYRFRDSAKAGQRVDSTLQAKFSNPERVQALSGVRLVGSLSAGAKVDLTRRVLQAQAKVDARGVSLKGTASAKSLAAELSAAGQLDAPTMQASVRAEGVDAVERHFRKVRVSASGTPKRLVADAELERSADERLRARATLALEGGLRVLEPSVVIEKSGDTVVLRAERVAAASGAVKVDGLALDGAGSLRGNVAFERGNLRAKLLLENLAPARLAKIVGVSIPLRRGIVSGEARVEGPLSRLTGELDLKAKELDFEHVRGGNVELKLSLDGKTVSGETKVLLNTSNFTLRLIELDLPRPPYTRQRLLATRGEIVALGRVDLGELETTLSALGAPIADARGKLDLDLHASNPREGGQGPKVDLTLETKGLRLVGKRPEHEEIESADVAREAQPLSIVGIDAALGLQLDLRARKGRLAVQLVDAQGPFAKLEGESALPNLESARFAEELPALAFRANLDVPKREIERLPDLARPTAIRGTVAANVTVQGTLLTPSATAEVRVQRLRARSDRRGIDGELKLDFDRNRGEISGEAHARAGKVATLASKWKGDLLARVRELESAAIPLEFDADLKLRRFPLGVIQELSDRGIRGPIDGDISLTGLGDKPRLEVKLDGSGLKIDNARLGKLDVSAEAVDGSMKARVDVGAKGSLRAEFGTPIRWQRELVPTVDPRAKVTLNAKQFDLSTVAPLVQSYVSALEGSLDAAFEAEFADGAPRLRGQAELANGAIQIPQIGQRFSDVSAKVRVAEGQIKLESLQASGLSGRLSAKGQATLVGTDLRSASGALDIKKDEKLPITLEGQAVGDAWGHIDVKYARSDAGADLRVDIPNFQIELPDAPLPGVQSLPADEHVKVGWYRDDGKFAAIPLQVIKDTQEKPAEPAEPTRVAVHLGSVWVERQNQVKVELGGNLTIVSGEETDVDGKIELKGGKLDVSGKTFDIESGTVSFDGDDPADPTITAVARWDSPENYAVYAEYTGTVKAGKLTLRSEPPLTQSEVLSLIMFGSTEGQLGASQGGSDNMATALGVAGGAATQGFNRVMSDFTQLDVSARIDTSTGSARPEIVVQVSPRVTTRVTRALGEPTQGQSPDRTFLTLEFRLKRSWLLAAMLGDRGASSLDLVWRKRY